MFADLVGSTALATGMDPEDLREVFASYSRCAEETVANSEEPSLNTWGTVSSRTSAIRTRMKTTPTGR